MADRRYQVAFLLIWRCSVDGRKRYENNKCGRKSFWKRSKTALFPFTIQYNTIQYNTVQYSTVQYSTVQYNTIQFISSWSNSYSLVTRTSVDRAWIRNTILSPIDKRGGQSWKATNYRYSLVSLMDEPLSDIYRQIHPITKSFTNESKPLNLKSRTDFFLISRSLSSFVKN